MKYNDRPVRWLIAFAGAAIITQYGNDDGFLSFSHVLTPAFLIELGCSVIIALVLVELVALVTRFLDRHFDWRERSVIRTLAQTILGIALPAWIDFQMASFYFGVYDIDIADTVYPDHMPYIVTLIGFVNIYYLSRYLGATGLTTKELTKEAVLGETNGSEGSEEPEDVPTQELVEGFWVADGIARLFVPIGEICCFFHNGDINFLHTFDQNYWAVNQSLDSIENAVDQHLFFRLNRQVLVHRKTIYKVIRLPFGKAKVVLHPALPVELPATISQKKRIIFRKWLEDG